MRSFLGFMAALAVCVSCAAQQKINPATQIQWSNTGWSTGAVNGSLNPAACGTTNAPSWCSGSDLGAWTNAAISQAASSGLSVTIGGLTGTVNIANTIQISHSGVVLTPGPAIYRGTSNLQSNIAVTSVSLGQQWANIGEACGTLTSGEAPLPGGIISVSGTVTGGGEFNIARALLASTRLNAGKECASFYMGGGAMATFAASSTTMTVQLPIIGMMIPGVTQVSGTGIAAGTTVSSVSGSTVTLSAATTTAETNSVVNFSVPNISVTSDSGTMTVANPIISDTVSNTAINCYGFGDSGGNSAAGPQFEPYGNGGGIYAGEPSNPGYASPYTYVTGFSLQNCGISAAAGTTPGYGVLLQNVNHAQLSGLGIEGNGLMRKGIVGEGLEQSKVFANHLSGTTVEEVAMRVYGYGTNGLAAPNRQAGGNGVNFIANLLQPSQPGDIGFDCEPGGFDDCHFISNECDSSNGAQCIQTNAGINSTAGTVEIIDNHLECAYSSSYPNANTVVIAGSFGATVLANPSINNCGGTPNYPSILVTQAASGTLLADNGNLSGGLEIDSGVVNMTVSNNYWGGACHVTDNGTDTTWNNTRGNCSHSDTSYTGFISGNPVWLKQWFGPQASQAGGTSAQSYGEQFVQKNYAGSEVCWEGIGGDGTTGGTVGTTYNYYGGNLLFHAKCGDGNYWMMFRELGNSGFPELVPGSNASADLGDPSYEWRNGYFNNFVQSAFLTASSSHGCTTEGGCNVGNGSTNDPADVYATNFIQSPRFVSTAAQTTVNCSTSGTAVFSQPQIGASYKQTVISLSSCTGTASYTFPAVYTVTPGIFAGSTVSASLVTSLSTSAVTVTGSASTGIIDLKAY